MGNSKKFAVIGAGIIGCAVARELKSKFPDASVTLIDKEEQIGQHQTSHNSGVVHAGLYYEPGSFKAKLCRRGVHLLKEFTYEKGLPYEECGKLVVALDHIEQKRLSDIYTRARANNVPGLKMLGPAGIRDIEPNVTGLAALQSPGTAIIDYGSVAQALADDVVSLGGQIELGSEVQHFDETNTEVVIHTSTGEFRVDYAVVCAGLQSDRLARLAGSEREPYIVPFYGQYFQLEAAYRNIVNGLIYPVPDPKFPFLGVHLTKRIDGEMMVGPNAFLSFSREKYHGLGLNIRDFFETIRKRGFWKFAGKNIDGAIREAQTVLSKKAFLQGASRYVPTLEGADAVRLTRGIRAQAMDSDGSLVDDFRIDHDKRVVHIRNAPSPGATSSMALAEHIVSSLDSQNKLAS